MACPGPDGARGAGVQVLGILLKTLDGPITKASISAEHGSGAGRSDAQESGSPASGSWPRRPPSPRLPNVSCGFGLGMETSHDEI